MLLQRPIDLSVKESNYEFGYAMLVISGAQRSSGVPPAGLGMHTETLELLISRGVPLNASDIVGYTVLHHLACSPMGVQKPALARTLLSRGANVNQQNRYGEVPLFLAMQTNSVELVEVFLECGADLDLREADGLSPREFFIKTGPQITAVVTKWIRKREGKEGEGEGPNSQAFLSSVR
jgi:ankyrin repeat protein